MPQQRGFTLLELLVVVVLMALLTAAALSSLNFTPGGDDIKTEAQRIGALVELAAEEALLTGREIGMQLEKRRLSFWYFDDIEQRWLPLDDGDGVFRTRELPDSIDSDLVLEGQPVVLGNDAEAPEADDADQPEPQVLMFSSGQMTGFILLLESIESDEAWQIEADLLGRVEVKELQQ